MADSLARARNQAPDDNLSDLRADLREHASVDRLQFSRLDERMEDLMRNVGELKTDVATLTRTFNRVAWSGWTIAGGLVGLLARTFLGH